MVLSTFTGLCSHHPASDHTNLTECRIETLGLIGPRAISLLIQKSVRFLLLLSGVQTRVHLHTHVSPTNRHGNTEVSPEKVSFEHRPPGACHTVFRESLSKAVHVWPLASPVLNVCCFLCDGWLGVTGPLILQTDSHTLQHSLGLKIWNLLPYYHSLSLSYLLVYSAS